MAKVEVDIQDNSLDSSGDGELLGMVDEGSFESADDKNTLVAQSFLDAAEEESGSAAYHFKDLSSLQCRNLSAGGVTYRFVPMSSEEEVVSHQTAEAPGHILPGGEFYVISNPVEVFGQTQTQKKSIRRDPVQSKAITTKKRDDKRRATHNEVERRRRDKINSWITKLAALIPNSGLPDSASKGGILAKACDHITELTEKQKRFEKLEMDNDKLVTQVLKLNQELSDLRKENMMLRNQYMDETCVIVQRPKNQKS